MKHKRFFIFTSVFFIMLWSTAFSAVAIGEASEHAISVKPLLPENQKVGVAGYFNLSVNSNDQQTIYVQITNNKNENMMVALVPANAYTRPDGGIFYSEKIDSLETVLTDEIFALSNYISMDHEVAIKPNETVNVPIEITVPDMKTGSILGGVLISELVPAREDIKEETDEETNEDEAQFKVLTKSVFAIAIQLDLPEQPTPAFSFGNAGFNPVGPNAYIAMRNDAPMIQRQISGTYQVTNKEGEELFAGIFEPVSMAPKTQVNFPMHWNSSILEPGNYTLSIAANVEGKEMVVEESINIDKAAVEVYAESVNQPIAQTQVGIPYWVAIAAVVIISGILLVWKKKKE